MIGTFVGDARAWAERVFSKSLLPDARLNVRLVEYAYRQALNPTGSTARVSVDKAQREGAYRFLENERIDPKGIEQGPFAETVDLSPRRRCLLAIQDTSSVSVHSNELREELKSAGSPTGFMVHSTLMVDADTGEILGLGSQQRWLRKGSKARQSPVAESGKWRLANLETRARFQKMNEQIISVADREGDIYDFIKDQIDRGDRFIIRSCYNRKIKSSNTGDKTSDASMMKLFESVRSAPVIGTRRIRIEQRGATPHKIGAPGRPSRSRRDVDTELRALTVLVAPCDGSTSPLQLNVVHVKEVPSSATDQDGNRESFEWFLLTSEPIGCIADVEFVVRCYEYRWTIEEFHKCWKTGCRLEKRPLESIGAVERMMVITAAIAIRILQLHAAGRSDKIDKSVTTTLTREEWQCLWASTEKRPMPKTAPSASWALYAVAKLGCWHDTKRTGTVGWSTLWHGWSCFQERLSGWLLARTMRI